MPLSLFIRASSWFCAKSLSKMIICTEIRTISESLHRNRAEEVLEEANETKGKGVGDITIQFPFWLKLKNRNLDESGGTERGFC